MEPTAMGATPVRGDDGDRREELPPEKRTARVLHDDVLLELGRIAERTP